MKTRTSTPGKVIRQWGGVGRNIAEVVARLGGAPKVLTAIGADAAGKQMLEHLRILGADTSAVVVSNAHGTGTYLAVLDEKGDLFATVADMDVNNVLNAESVMASITSKTPIVMLDANISQATVEAVCRHCHTLQVPVWFEPTSATKGMRGLPSFIDGLVQFVSPSLQETERWLEALDKRGAARGGEDPIARGKEDVRVLLGSIAHPRPGVTYTVVQKLGEDGVVLGRWLADSGPAATHSRFWHIPAARLPSLKNTSGAGDTLVGTCVWALCRCLSWCVERTASKGWDDDEVHNAVIAGCYAASLTLQSTENVSPLISATVIIEKYSSMFHPACNGGLDVKLRSTIQAINNTYMEAE